MAQKLLMPGDQDIKNKYGYVILGRKETVIHNVMDINF